MDRGDTPYARYIPLEGEEEAADHTKKRVRLREMTEDQGSRAGSSNERLIEECGDSRAVAVEARARSPSRLRHRLKQMKAEFSHEGKGVADAFIDSTENRPQRIKDGASNDLLV